MPFAESAPLTFRPSAKARAWTTALGSLKRKSESSAKIRFALSKAGATRKGLILSLRHASANPSKATGSYSAQINSGESALSSATKRRRLGDALFSARTAIPLPLPERNRPEVRSSKSYTSATPSLRRPERLCANRSGS